MRPQFGANNNMKRKIYNKLLQWKNQWGGKTAILIDGARRVGKSYIAEEFARNEYKSYLLIDFNNANQRIKQLFEVRTPKHPAIIAPFDGTIDFEETPE